MGRPDAKPTPIVLTLLALPDERAIGVRLRNLLKTALRRDRLRCLSVEGLPEEGKKTEEVGA
jgi:hypothetical protein